MTTSQLYPVTAGSPLPRTSRPVTQSHFEWFVKHFSGPKWNKTGTKVRVICSAHDDHSPSLDIELKDGAILMTCRAGCKNADILDRVGLDSSAFFMAPELARDPPFPQPQSSKRRPTTWGSPTGRWVYEDVDGAVFGEVVRYDPPGERKQIIPYWFNGTKMVKGKGEKEWPLYRARQLSKLPTGSRVYLPAGEKCADAIAQLGLNATTHQGGESAWQSTYAEALSDLEVIICEDNDDAGRKWGRQIREDLVALKGKCRTVAFSELEEKGDVFDWIHAGHSKAELEARADAAKVHQLPECRTRPELSQEALYGLAGDVVRAFEPYTEAHPAAVLGTFLVFFGNCVGPGPSIYVGETKHGTNLFAVICGATSRSRKGTSSAPIVRLFNEVDPLWLDQRRLDGIGSGEALIWALRDETEDDPGVKDKRQLVHESEFSTVLKVANRDGSILGENIRKGWDREKPLTNLTKRSNLRASNHHISFLGHITVEELQRELTETDQSNGVGNRILWIHTHRPKLLANPGRLPEDDLQALAKQVKTAVERADNPQIIKKTPEAEALWEVLYPELSKDYPGLFGSITARAEAQVLRLSLIYALLDSQRSIDVQHLMAARAFWTYCEDSARHIFGDRIGDPVADRIHQALRTSGSMTEKDIHDLFQRNQKASRIQAALEVLATHDLIKLELLPTNGRSARVWSVKS